MVNTKSTDSINVEIVLYKDKKSEKLTTNLRPGNNLLWRITKASKQKRNQIPNLINSNGIKAISDQQSGRPL